MLINNKEICPNKLQTLWMHFSCTSEHVYMHKTRSVAFSSRPIFIFNFACLLLASLKEK
jgi:hypothetical protein